MGGLGGHREGTGIYREVTGEHWEGIEGTSMRLGGTGRGLGTLGGNWEHWEVLEGMSGEQRNAKMGLVDTGRNWANLSRAPGYC